MCAGAKKAYVAKKKLALYFYLVSLFTGIVFFETLHLRRVEHLFWARVRACALWAVCFRTV